MIKQLRLVSNNSVTVKSKQNSASPVDITSILDPFADTRNIMFEHQGIRWEESTKGNLNIKFGRVTLFTIVKNLTVAEGSEYKFSLNQEKSSKTLATLGDCAAGPITKQEAYTVMPFAIELLNYILDKANQIPVMYNAEQIKILKDVISGMNEFIKINSLKEEVQDSNVPELTFDFSREEDEEFE